MEADIITIKEKNPQKHWSGVFSSKDAFLLNMFQMTAITLVSVANHYHINGLHLF